MAGIPGIITVGDEKWPDKILPLIIVVISAYNTLAPSCDSAMWLPGTTEIYSLVTVSTVVLNCCKGDRPSQWEYPIFGPL